MRIRLCNESDSDVLNAYRLVLFHMQGLWSPLLLLLLS